MPAWKDALAFDPLPALLKSPADPALAYFVRRDLLEDSPGSPQQLWEQPDALRLLKKQQADGRFVYPGRHTSPSANYDLLESFRNLRLLVDMYALNAAHPAIARLADYFFSCQTAEGDLRGILSNQYMPYYHAGILSLLLKAGVVSENMARGLDWLLTIQQEDGGWLIPYQAVPAKDKTEEHWQAAPLPPDTALPHAHLVTGMVLLAFAEAPAYRPHPQVQRAADALKTRFFKPDKYNDRKAVEYWFKFQYPFWWTNLLTGLYCLDKLGFSAQDADVQAGIAWFIENQQSDGLWDHGYGKGVKSDSQRKWVGLAVCRVLKSLLG